MSPIPRNKTNLAAKPPKTVGGMPEKHRHHYVPQGYLRGFTIPGETSLLWEFDKRTGKVSSCPKSVRSVCYRFDHNLLEWRDGTKDSNLVEDWLDKNVESPALKIIKEFKVDPTQRRMAMPIPQKEALSLFVAFLLTRGPSFRDGVEKTMQWVNEWMLRKEIELGNLTLPPNTTCRVKVPYGASVGAMGHAAAIGAESLLKKKWLFVAPYNGQHFVTSDSPVGIGAPHNFVGPFHPDSTVFLPLHKELALLVKPGCNEKGFVNTGCFDGERTIDFNTLVVRNADRYVYGSEKNL